MTFNGMIATAEDDYCFFQLEQCCYLVSQLSRAVTSKLQILQFLTRLHQGRRQHQKLSVLCDFTPLCNTELPGPPCHTLPLPSRSALCLLQTKIQLQTQQLSKILSSNDNKALKSAQITGQRAVSRPGLCLQGRMEGSPHGNSNLQELRAELRLRAQKQHTPLNTQFKGRTWLFRFNCLPCRSTKEV